MAKKYEACSIGYFKTSSQQKQVHFLNQVLFFVPINCLYNFRSLTSSSVTSLRNRKPLSPISRPTLPISAQTTHNNNEGLEIQGKHVTLGQSLKLSIPGTSWDCNARSSKSKKKRNHLKIKS